MPPSSTKTAVYQWNKDIEEVCRQIEQLHVRYLSRLHQHYEAVCKGCLDQIDKHKVIWTYSFVMGTFFKTLE